MEDGSNMIKIGPAGSQVGRTWDEKGRAQIVQIFVSHGDEINSIQFQYAENGALVLSERHGRNNGDNFDVVKLKHPKEYITRISGRWKCFFDDHLCSITFGTNHANYGPFGRFTANDKEFAFKLGEERQFGGFHGTADTDAVRSIGLYLNPKMTLEEFIKIEEAA